MNLKTLLIFLSFVIIGIVYLKLNTGNSKHPSGKPTSSKAKEANISEENDKQDHSEPNTQSTAAAKNPPPSKIKEWLDQNSNSLSSFSETDRKALNEQIQKLTKQDLRELHLIALSKEQPANQRILSIYLIGESSLGAQALAEFLRSDVDLKENAPPHSVDEAANSREKALRAMAIEQLIKNSPTPQIAYQKLSQLIPKMTDPWLKDFVQRRMSEIPH